MREKVKKVGKVYPGEKNPFPYSKVIFDEDGWADASKFLPIEFDLCYCKTECGKTIIGWCAGISWDGLKMNREYKILFWKQNFNV